MYHIDMKRFICWLTDLSMSRVTRSKEMSPKLTYQEAADYVWKQSQSIRKWYLNETGENSYEKFDLDNYTHSEYRTFGCGAPGDVIADIVFTGVSDGIITEDENGEYSIP